MNNVLNDHDSETISKNICKCSHAHEERKCVHVEKKIGIVIRCVILVKSSESELALKEAGFLIFYNLSSVLFNKILLINIF